MIELQSRLGDISRLIKLYIAVFELFLRGSKLFFERSDLLRLLNQHFRELFSVEFPKLVDCHIDHPFSCFPFIFAVLVCFYLKGIMLLPDTVFAVPKKHFCLSGGGIS
jgi:hypothetical protein